MRYIIMCGGTYHNFKIPKQLTKINGETLIERTIRLLRENGVIDIFVSTNLDDFDFLDVPILKTKDDFEVGEKIEKGCWLNAYYPIEEPVVYLHGDVYFSEQAIKKIIEATNQNKNLFICTFDGSDKRFVRDEKNVKGREPFGYIVCDQKKFRKAVDDLIQMQLNGEFDKGKAPFSWHVYRYLNGMDLCKRANTYTKINNIFNTDGDYLIINDETMDIDTEKDAKELEENLKRWYDV